MAGIYIHIPFCRKLCHYCDFYHVIYKDNHTAYIDAVIKEAELRREYTGNETISTIYFGGGTPSLIPPDDTRIIIDHIRSSFDVEPDSEITIEVNPDDVSREFIDRLKDSGINRVSIGIQSFSDDDLRMLNRRHTGAQAGEAIEEILDAGFENVTIDIIYGLPGMDLNKLQQLLDKALSFGIKHFSAYHLTVEPGTVFGKMKQNGSLREIDEEQSILQYNYLLDRAEAEGFVHYEISNFGKEGFFSRHNTNYWKQVSYLGLGASAHSFNGYSRQWNVRNTEEYIRKINAGKDFFEREELDTRTRFNEYIMTSLRTMWGIDLEYIEKAFDREGYDYARNTATRFIGYGMMKSEKNTLVLTRQGEMISDNIISEFMMP